VLPFRILVTFWPFSTWKITHPVLDTLLASSICPLSKLPEPRSGWSQGKTGDIRRQRDRPHPFWV
jgi:hypothetical protein